MASRKSEVKLDDEYTVVSHTINVKDTTTSDAKSKRVSFVPETRDVAKSGVTPPHSTKIPQVDIVIHHKMCPDGLSGALFLTWNNHHLCKPPPLLIAAHQNDRTVLSQLPRDLSTKTVAIVDVGFPKRAVQFIVKHAKRVIVFDHHTSNYNMFAELLPPQDLVFDEAKCAALLVWERGFGTYRPPPVLNFIDDLDTYNWRVEGSVVASFAIKAHFAALRDDSSALELIRAWYAPESQTAAVNGLMYQGAILKSSHCIQVAEIVRYSRVLRFKLKMFSNIIVSAVNGCPGSLVCDVGHSLASNSKTRDKIGCIWSYDPVSKTTKVCLRSIEPTRVDTIAAEYGGGGQRCAASFKLNGGSIDDVFEPAYPRV